MSGILTNPKLITACVTGCLDVATKCNPGQKLTSQIDCTRRCAVASFQHGGMRASAESAGPTLAEQLERARTVGAGFGDNMCPNRSQHPEPSAIPIFVERAPVPSQAAREMAEASAPLVVVSGLAMFLISLYLPARAAMTSLMMAGGIHEENNPANQI